MNLKVNILSKIIETDEEVVYIVGRHWWAYRGVIIKSIIFTSGAFLLYYTLEFISSQVALIVSSTLGLLLYILINIEFFDVYLDNVLFTPSNIIIFKWYGLFNNTMDTITFHSVESLYQEQHGIIDLFLDKGRLVIRRQGHENIFENIPHAGKIIKEINVIMEKYGSWGHSEEEVETNHGHTKDDFGLFVEAMGEIMREYKDSKGYEEEEIYEYEEVKDEDEDNLEKD